MREPWEGNIRIFEGEMAGYLRDGDMERFEHGKERFEKQFQCLVELETFENLFGEKLCRVVRVNPSESD